MNFKKYLVTKTSEFTCLHSSKNIYFWDYPALHCVIRDAITEVLLKQRIYRMHCLYEQNC